MEWAITWRVHIALNLLRNVCTIMTALQRWFGLNKQILLPLTAFPVSGVMKSATSEYKPRSRMENMHRGHSRVSCSCDSHKHLQFLLNSASALIRWFPEASQVQDYAFRVCTDRSAHQVWTPLGSIQDPRPGIFLTVPEFWHFSLSFSDICSCLSFGPSSVLGVSCSFLFFVGMTLRLFKMDIYEFLPTL